MIHYTIDILGALIGPLFGILLADFYVVKKQKIVVDDLYTMNPEGSYWYENGYNKKAVYALIPAALVPIMGVLIPQLSAMANFSWFIGMGLGFVIYIALMKKK